jgi:hypothetical protein
MKTIKSFLNKEIGSQNRTWRDYDLWVPEFTGITAGILTLILLGLRHYINE